MKFNFKNLKIVEKLKIFLPITLAILLTGIILIFTVGMNIGLDFSGGAQVQISFGEFDSAEQKQSALEIVRDTCQENGFEIGQERWSSTDESESLEIGLEYKLNGEEVNADNEDAQTEFLKNIKENLEEQLILNLNEGLELDLVVNENVSSRIVQSTTANRLLKNALWATAVAVVAILIYIAFRFTISSGLAAIIALVHDVLFMFALVTFFQVQINTTFIAAIITIVGYSINATIVIFDRVRELKKLPSMANSTDSEIANKAIENTLSRSILTSVTTLITIIALSVVCAILGVPSMQEFALPIIFGIIGGFYSSVFLSAPIWVHLRKFGKFIKNLKFKSKKA